MLKNYEINKFVVENPDIVNLAILSIFFFFTFVSFKQKKLEGTSASYNFDMIVTDQVRGVAIFLVILGHFWVHCSVEKPSIVMSGDGVTLFLLLSGFGICRSLENRHNTLKEFTIKRINRIMIPYWVITLFIILLDYIILKRAYSPVHIFFTFIGINVWGMMHHFDFVRWYITFLLVWYLIVYFSFSNREKKYYYLIPAIFAIILMPLDYYVFRFEWYQFLAFPIGCIIGVNYNLVKNKIKTIYLLLSGSLLLTITIVIKIYAEIFFSDKIPSFINYFLIDFNSILFSIAIILIIQSFNKYRSLFLILIGKYSYELFLLHGVFLVKYNPILKESNIVISFMTFLFILLILSYCFQKFFMVLRIR